MPLAALAVHELRYLLAFGGQAGQELGAQGHAYLTSVTPTIVLVAALAFGCFVARFARAWQGEGTVEDPPSHPLLRVWLLSATGLLLIYICQETLEGFFATGHPEGLAGVFGDGGWWSGPAALFVGALIALLLRSADAAISFVAHVRGHRRELALPRPAQRRARPPLVLLPRVSPLARSLAGRGPPAVGLLT